MAPPRTGMDRKPKRRVVVGVDGSASATKALEWAAEEAERTSAVLEIHTASGPGYVLAPPKDVKQAMQVLLEKEIERAKKIAPDVVVKGVSHEGTPTSALITASKGADLLVVGSRGRGGFSGLLLGSVSQQCALHAHCPVVIVRKVETQAAGKGKSA